MLKRPRSSVLPSVAMKTFLISVKASSGVGAELAAEAGLLEAAERRPVAHRGVRVHRQVAGLDPAGDPDRAADVAGPDRPGQAVRGVVGQRDRLAPRRRTASPSPPGRRSPRPGRVAGADRREHRRRDTRSQGRPARCRGTRPARLPARSSRTCARCAAEISGPISRVLGRRVADPHALHGGLEQLHEPVVRRRSTRIRDRAQQSCPALSKTAYGAVGRRPLDVGVGEDDVGALAAELQRQPLDLLRRSRP